MHNVSDPCMEKLCYEKLRMCYGALLLQNVGLIGGTIKYERGVP